MFLFFFLLPKHFTALTHSHAREQGHTELNENINYIHSKWTHCSCCGEFYTVPVFSFFLLLADVSDRAKKTRAHNFNISKWYSLPKKNTNNRNTLITSPSSKTETERKMVVLTRKVLCVLLSNCRRARYLQRNEPRWLPPLINLYRALLFVVG